MKTLTAMSSSLALAALIFNPLAASAAPTQDPPWVASAFGSAGTVPDGATLLSAPELASSTGRLAPLAIALGIAGVDIALMSFYWGIYVPQYGGGGGSCAVCNNSKLNSH
tara:strand:+ start:2569 stop:2898 length:330 start_codon:yes stop_codon:yes gene_type:complete